MKTPTRTHRSLAWALGTVPSATQSTTALATAAWAGPNIWTAWFAPLIVTLLNMTVSGLAGTLGASTARSPLWPAVWSATRWAKAMPTGPLFDPIMRSMWATSLPSPTSDSPTMKLWLSAIRSSRQSSVLSVWDADHNDPACEPPMHPPSSDTTPGWDESLRRHPSDGPRVPMRREGRDRSAHDPRAGHPAARPSGRS